MAPKAFVILGILFFLMKIPSMKSESQTVKDSSSDEAAQNNPTDGGTAPSTTRVPPENVVGGRPYRETLPDRETSPYHGYPALVPSDDKFVLLLLALGASKVIATGSLRNRCSRQAGSRCELGGTEGGTLGQTP